MTKASSIARLAGFVILCFLAGFILLIGLAFIIHSGWDDLLFHLCGGFYFFLRKNLPSISTDAATWVPGLTAFALASWIAHRMLRSWASRRNRAWSLRTTAGIMLIAPLLFAIAFIVPGALLQVDSLRHVNWFQRERHTAAFVKLTLRNYAQACNAIAREHPEGRLPNSLEQIHKMDYLRRGFMDPNDDDEMPSELPIYLGSGHTIESISTLPLLISPPYQTKSRTIRSVITIDGEFLEITEEETDGWIDRALRQPDSRKTDR